MQMDVLDAPSIDSLGIGAPEFTTLNLKGIERGWIGRLFPFLTRRSYKIVLDIAALRLAESFIHKDMADVRNWLDLSSSDLAVILWAGLFHFQPKSKITREQVETWLTPAHHNSLWLMLFDQCFPGYRDKVQKVREAVENASADPKKAELQSV